MPKVSLESARARDDDILQKLHRVTKAAQSHKQQTRLHQQRHEWIEQACLLKRDSRRLEDELNDSAAELGLQQDSHWEDERPEVWQQVAGLRQLLLQLRRREPQRLRENPQQALQLEEVFKSVALALHGQSQQLSSEASLLEEDCKDVKRRLRCEVDLGTERCDLSDEEDNLLDQIGDEEDYRRELEDLNVQVASSLSDLEEELLQLRKKRDWDDDAHFRFLHIKREFQGKRDLLMERMRLEFPHLTREQLLQHEAVCDSWKYAVQRQAAIFRQWRRDRLALLQQHQQMMLKKQRALELQQKRLQEMQEIKEKGKVLQGRLQVERQKALAKRQERELVASEEQKRHEALQAEKEQKYRQRAEAVRQLSHNFAEQRREQQQREKEDALQQQQRKPEVRTARMERNGRVVEMRRQLDELKQKEVAQKRAAVEQEQLERQMALQRALENLKVEAPRDPARLHKIPERLKEEAYSDPLVCVTRGPSAGFAEHHLMADARYKLSAALQQAGLYSTKAGQEALARVAAPKPAQPYLMSQVFGYPH